MVHRSKSLFFGIFLLRLGAGSFLTLCALDKLIEPQASIKMFFKLYALNLSVSSILLLGACELVLGLFILLGVYKTITYGLGLVVHAIFTASLYQELFYPFGNHQLFLMTIPILLLYVALFLLRKFDTKWTLQKKKSIFS